MAWFYITGGKPHTFTTLHVFITTDVKGKQKNQTSLHVFITTMGVFFGVFKKKLKLKHLHVCNFTLF